MRGLHGETVLQAIKYAWLTVNTLTKAPCHEDMYRFSTSDRQCDALIQVIDIRGQI